MRILIFLLALISAFFVSSVYSFQLDMDNLLSPKSDSVHLFKCHFVTDWGPTYDPTIESTPSTAMDDCSSWGLENIDREQVCGSTSVVGVYYGMFIKPRNQLREDGTCIIGGNGGGTVTFTAEDLGETVSYSCPPTQSSLHIYEVSDPQNPSSIMCAKELTIEPDSDCPAPTENDPFVFGTGQQQTVCFNNQDGTQCSIETDENGNFYMPVSYGSQEPVACTQIDPTDPDPTDPDPTDPDPTDPDPTDPDPTNPDQTLPPDERPDPEDTDDTDKTEVLDAVNQVNDNLDAINNNMLDGIESHEERLDRMAEEVQISNELLAAISDGQAEGNGYLSDIADGQVLGNDLLEEIAENTQKEDFSITSRRKADEGLNTIFSSEDLQQVKDEIDAKKEELDSLIETIQNEARSLIDIPSFPSAGYEERIVNIKGADVDLGLGRISDFFKLIGPAVLLCATLTALYILLGSKE